MMSGLRTSKGEEVEANLETSFEPFGPLVLCLETPWASLKEPNLFSAFCSCRCMLQVGEEGTDGQKAEMATTTGSSSPW